MKGLPRMLHATRRRVAAGKQSAYLKNWERLAAAVGALGGHAWLFRSAVHDRDFMEFIEYGGEVAILKVDEVKAARAALERDFGEARAETWKGVQ